MNVYFIRHTSVDVSSSYCYGHTDVPLKETFEEEAAEVKKKIENINFDFQFTSPLSRCFKLADYCGFSEAIRDERLKEINFGKWEGQEFHLIKDPEFGNWLKDPIRTAPAQGESFEQLYERVADFMSELCKLKAQNVVVFAHGGVLLCAQIYAGLIEMENAFEHLTPFGGMLQLSFENR